MNAGTTTKPIAIYHEHPSWFDRLFAELDRRGTPYVRIDATAHRYDPSEREVPYSLVFNRASPSAYLRGHGHVTFYTLSWLRHLERLGVPVVNGSKPYSFEISKADQIGMLRKLGLPHPASRVINHPSQAPAAAAELRFPVLVKANIGGSGAGITRFDAPTELAAAAAAGALDFGVDHVALVQELVPFRDGHITRLETLAGRFLYALDVFPPAGSYNLCPGTMCRTEDAPPPSPIAASCTVEAEKKGSVVRAASPRPPSSPPSRASRRRSGSTSAASSCSSTTATACPISMTSTRCRTSWPTRRGWSASTRSCASPTS